MSLTPTSEVAQIVEQAMRAWQAKDRDAYLDCYRPDATLQVGGEEIGCGHDGVGEFFDHWWKTAPDNRIDLEWVHHADDVVVHEGVFHGTHTDDSGEQPGGRAFRAPYTEVFVVRDGLIAQQRLYFDSRHINP
ncbi:nuclear transport factor 2 family protein [Streptomyces sp. NPDC059003]|uniref:nuclear transport factor 2 family protein n=1 Tax=Streptomyces sp. NPDC059003 TaxID=3346691 RepID=UPI0036B1AECA